MKIKIIAAVDEAGGIGKGGALPWGKIPKDLRYFKQMTKDHPVIMGRRTLESIGHPLPARKNLILSTTMGEPDPELIGKRRIFDFNGPGDHARWIPAYASLDLCLADCADRCAHPDRRPWFWPSDDTVWVIGGAGVFAEAVPLADEIHITRIQGRFDCDRFFPSFSGFAVARRWEDRSGGYGLNFTVYRRAA